MTPEQKMVAILTTGHHHRDDIGASFHDLLPLLQGSSRAELIAMIATLSATNNMLLERLESHAAEGWTREGFLRELGLFFSDGT